MLSKLSCHACSLSRLQMFFPIAACILFCAFFKNVHFDTILNYEQRDSRRCFHEISALLGCYCRSLVVTDVSGQPIGHAFKGDAPSDCLAVENGPICCPEMTVTTRKLPEERISHTAPEDRYHAYGFYINRRRQQYCCLRSEWFM